MPVQLTSNAQSVLVEAPCTSFMPTKTSVQESVTGIILQKERSVLKSVPRSARPAKAVISSPTILITVAESLNADPTQDQISAHLTSNAQSIYPKEAFLTLSVRAQELNTLNRRLPPQLATIQLVKRPRPSPSLKPLLPMVSRHILRPKPRSLVTLNR